MFWGEGKATITPTSPSITAPNLNQVYPDVSWAPWSWLQVARAENVTNDTTSHWNSLVSLHDGIKNNLQVLLPIVLLFLPNNFFFSWGLDLAVLPFSLVSSHRQLIIPTHTCRGTIPICSRRLCLLLSKPIWVSGQQNIRCKALPPHPPHQQSKAV